MLISWGWDIFMLYCAGYLFNLWYMSGTIAWSMAVEGYYGSERHNKPDSEDWVWGTLFGSLGGFIWPLCLPCCFIYNNGGSSSKLAYTPKRWREKQKEIDLQLREDRLKEMEIEVGIR